MSATNKGQARAAEPEGFAAARGYAALRAEAERSAGEARLCAEEAMRNNHHELADFARGWRAGLEKLLETFDASEEAPHTVRADVPEGDR